MGWILLCLAAWLLLILLVPWIQYKWLWPAGLTGLFLIYIIDTILISLGAFLYSHSSLMLSRLPVFYWLGAFPAGMLFFYFYPRKNSLQILYVFAISAVFLLLEQIMLWAGSFHYLQWNPWKSYLLNILGFTSLAWFTGHFSPKK